MAYNNHQTDDVKLYVKAGREGSSYGACVFCQRILMELLLKAEHGMLNVTMTTVNRTSPPAEFELVSTRTPVLFHNNQTIIDNEEIVEYIRNTFPEPALLPDSKTAVSKSLDIFSKFTKFVKDIDASSKPLLIELQRLNVFLAESGTTYLSGDELSDIDCLMMAKLHQIRISCQALKQIVLPHELTALWRYLGNAYELEIFRKSCPADEEIIHFWGNKMSSYVGVEPEVRNIIMNTLDSISTTYTFSVPEF